MVIPVSRRAQRGASNRVITRRVAPKARRRGPGKEVEVEERGRRRVLIVVLVEATVLRSISRRRSPTQGLPARPAAGLA
jgi:hypothetical protein